MQKMVFLKQGTAALENNIEVDMLLAHFTRLCAPVKLLQLA